MEKQIKELGVYSLIEYRGAIMEVSSHSAGGSSFLNYPNDRDGDLVCVDSNAVVIVWDFIGLEW